MVEDRELVLVVSRVQAILNDIEAVTRRVVALRAERDDAVRRAEDAERRAALDQRQADDMTERAGRAADLEDAGRELVGALDRLPLTMEKAGMKQMVVPPDIPLYGTHDWEAVEQAKRRLDALLPKGETDG